VNLSSFKQVNELYLTDLWRNSKDVKILRLIHLFNLLETDTSLFARLLYTKTVIEVTVPEVELFRR
jgi:hypothetical protein